MKSLIIVVVLQCYLQNTIASSCTEPYRINEQSYPENQRILAKTITAFALRFDSILSRTVTKHDNVILAPINLVKTLATVLLGAAGETEKELSSVLRMAVGKKLADNILELHNELAVLLRKVTETDSSRNTTASGVFVKTGIPVCPSFAILLRSIHQTDVIGLDFLNDSYQAANRINRWLSKRTNNKIAYLMEPPVVNETKLLFVESQYFNTEWQVPFIRAATTWAPFHLKNGRIGHAKKDLRVKMMTNRGQIPYYRDDDLGYTAIGLLRKNGYSMMFVVLPDVDVDLKTLTAGMTYVDIENMVKRYTIRYMFYYVPQLELSAKMDLRNPLEQLNVRSAFQPQLANFVNLTAADDGIYVDGIYHQIRMEINEAGKAGIAGTVTRGVVPVDYNNTFRANRPFIIFFYHLRLDVITLWASIVKPKPFNT